MSAPQGSPRVVAIGGGHGTAVSLRAARRYSEHLTAIVSVADDGGSSGRLRELLGGVALGDLRVCLGALAAPDSVLATSFEHRFAEGELAGHALGNLILAGLIEATGDLVRGIDEAASLLGAVGRVLPATTEPVVLKAHCASGEVNGQAAVARSGLISSVSIVPEDASTPRAAVEALERADQVVIGPGSLFTSVIAAASVRGIKAALAATSAQRVYVCNLRPQVPETEDYGVADHVNALVAHGITFDVVLADSGIGLGEGDLGVRVTRRSVADSRGLVHDPAKLAQALSDLLA